MKRKDKNGRTLRTGETQLKNGGYTYRKMRKGQKIEFYAPTLEALRDKEKDLQNEISQGVNVVKSKGFTINDAFDRYVKNRTDIRNTSLEINKNLFENHVRNSIGRQKVKDVLYSDVVAFYVDLMTKDDLSVATVNIIHNVLSYIYKNAIRDRIVTYNPVKGANTNAAKKAHKTLQMRHPLTETEQAEFTDYITHSKKYSYWATLCIFLLWTGCRIGEACAMTWDDVDIKHKKIYVNKTIVYVNSKYYMHPPKTEKGVRTIPIFDIVKKALIERKKYQFKHGFCQANVDGHSNFIFTSKSNKVMCSTTMGLYIRKIREDYAKNAGHEVPHITAHVFRHTFASRLVQSGANLKTIQEIMGHADIKTTLNLYAEMSDEYKQKEFEALESKLQIV